MLERKLQTIVKPFVMLGERFVERRAGTNWI